MQNYTMRKEINLKRTFLLSLTNAKGHIQLVTQKFILLKQVLSRFYPLHQTNQLQPLHLSAYVKQKQFLNAFLIRDNPASIGFAITNSKNRLVSSYKFQFSI